MLIYRLETNYGEGVYQTGILYKTNATYQGDRNKHPAPRDDSLFNCNCELKVGKDAWYNDFSGKYIFGFSSPAQLLRWFYNEKDLAILEENGIQISVYDCDDVIEGNTQLAFGKWYHLLWLPATTYLPTEFYNKFGKGVDK